jgi:hypothetical protein
MSDKRRALKKAPRAIAAMNYLELEKNRGA